MNVRVARIAAGMFACVLSGTAVAQSPKLPPVTRPSDSDGLRPLPSTRPSTAPTTAAVLDPAVLRLLDRVNAAYATTRPLAVSGTLVGTFDVAGRRRTYTLHVRGVTDGLGLYRHDATDAGLLVNDGHDAYLYDAQRNSYARLPATTRRLAADDVDRSTVAILLDEDPALLLTLADDPAALLKAVSQTPLRPATLPATAATTPAEAGLVIDRGGKTVTLWIDPTDGQIRRASLDYTPAFTARHTYGLKSAGVELTYGPADHTPTTTTTFTWQPPVTATEFTLQSELLHSAPASEPATAP